VDLLDLSTRLDDATDLLSRSTTRVDATVWKAAESMIQEVSVPIFKVAGLFALVASKGPTAVLERYGVINRVKSLYRAVVLDKDKEDFDREFLASQKMMRGRLVRIFPVPS
jgi:hypothetical protein